MPPVLIKHLLFPLHEALKGMNTLALLPFLEESQFWEEKRLQEYRLHRMQKFLLYAEQNVPFYRQLWQRAGFHAGAFHDLSDLARLPFLTRHDLQERFASLRATGYKGRTQTLSTGGSTGVPVAVLIDGQRMAAGVASRIRCQRWFGVDIGDREVVIWGSPIELGRQDWWRTMRDRALNSHLISAFNFSNAMMQQALQKILALQPQRMYGYAQSLALLAATAVATNRQEQICKAVFTTAEPLYPFQRSEIQQAFGGKVAVEYGARDAGFIAHECPQQKLHLNAEGLLVEIVDDAGQVVPAGEMGEIVVTNWDTPAMPMIRYRTGDIGAYEISPCPCGVKLPALKMVSGRAADFLIGHAERLIHPLGAIYILRELENVQQFRIVQHAPDEIELLLVLRVPLVEADRRKIQQKFNALLGAPVHLTYSVADAIPTLASGKFRYVECRVNK